MELIKRHKPPREKSLIKKELITGLFAIVLGAYNLLSTFDVINWGYEIPQLVGNILLVLAGFFLLGMAYKLGRYRYHTKHVF